MENLDTFKDFLVNQNAQISVSQFLINLLFVVVLSLVLGQLYVKYGRSLSNRRSFASTFMLIAVTTTLIITIVKSSLALSLGLVGALSIVRFRTAIKEPEELAFLFLSIALGLGFGANQRLVTLVAFVVICAVTVVRFQSLAKEETKNLYLTINSTNPGESEFVRIVEALRRNTITADLKRFDDQKDVLEALFQVEFKDLAQLEAVKSDLRKLSETIKISFLDNKGVVA